MRTENCVEILAKGSSDNPYTVRFYLEENRIAAFCSCPAGENRKLCKHVIRMISGDDSILYDDIQKMILNEITSRLQKTTIPPLLSELSESEILLKKAQQNAGRAKKALEKAVLGK